MTKREIYDVIATTFETLEVEAKDDVLAFIEKEREALDTRAKKAAERAAEKRAAGDELRARIQALLTEEPKTIAEIQTELDDEEVTPARVTARMTQLIKAEIVEKEFVKVGTRKLTAYRLA